MQSLASMDPASPTYLTQFVLYLVSPICPRYVYTFFILYLSSHSRSPQMRAQNQQDLIYKRGQAGVTKASVTIVFDNSDREKSPVGFENLKQITVTRQVRSQPLTHQCLKLMSYTDRTSKHIKIPFEWSQIAAE